MFWCLLHHLQGDQCVTCSKIYMYVFNIMCIDLEKRSDFLQECTAWKTPKKLKLLYKLNFLTVKLH